MGGGCFFLPALDPLPAVHHYRRREGRLLAHLYKSPSLPAGTAAYTITADGVRSEPPLPSTEDQQGGRECAKRPRGN